MGAVRVLEQGGIVDWSALLGNQVAPWGIVSVVVLMVLTDRLVTRGRLAQVIAERDAWQKAYQDEKDTTNSLLARERDNTTVAETVKHLLESLPTGKGGDHARGSDPA